ncbi:MAG: transcriptional regulator with GAF, ATPase, and Fis domain [Planctomycetota bacterium]
MPELAAMSSKNPRMHAFLDLVCKIALSDSSVLLLGETGVGKEYLARAIHASGPRREGPFVQVHCAALSESLLESELLGHVEGAFTGALRDRRGVFELAHNGTIFLDELGELSPQLQVKLLRVIQERSLQEDARSAQ